MKQGKVARPRSCHPVGRAEAVRRRRISLGRAFTLLETLVVIAILVLLIGILLPALSSARQSVRAFRCKTNMREVVFAFRLFGDSFSKGYRGDSDQRTDGRYAIEDFQESVYRIHEFWDVPGAIQAALEPARELLMCPAASSRLIKKTNLPCSDGAVEPKANISMALNMRLHRASLNLGGNFVSVQTALPDGFLSFGTVPLVFDVDGAAAISAAAPSPAPYYGAPPLPTPDFYSSYSFWFPAMRHQRRMDVGFVGGHVLSTRNPLAEGDWAYTPAP